MINRLAICSILFGVFFTSIFISTTSADDGSGCGVSQDISAQQLCYEQKIYQQNQIIKKQNEQLIRLGEINVCYSTNNYWYQNHATNLGWFSGTSYYGKCIDLLDSETK